MREGRKGGEGGRDGGKEGREGSEGGEGGREGRCASLGIAFTVALASNSPHLKSLQYSCGPCYL